MRDLPGMGYYRGPDPAPAGPRESTPSGRWSCPISFLDQPAARPSRIPYVNEKYLADEQALVRALAEEADPGASARAKNAAGDDVCQLPAQILEDRTLTSNGRFGSLILDYMN